MLHGRMQKNPAAPSASPRYGGRLQDADIVYPKSWAPFAAMEKRTKLYGEGDAEGIKALEKELLAQNAEHKDWCCTEELMKTTRDGRALYLHCLPADINGVAWWTARWKPPYLTVTVTPCTRRPATSPT